MIQQRKTPQIDPMSNGDWQGRLHTGPSHQRGVAKLRPDFRQLPFESFHTVEQQKIDLPDGQSPGCIKDVLTCGANMNSDSTVARMCLQLSCPFRHRQAVTNRGDGNGRGVGDKAVHRLQGAQGDFRIDTAGLAQGFRQRALKGQHAFQQGRGGKQLCDSRVRHQAGEKLIGMNGHYFR